MGVTLSGLGKIALLFCLGFMLFYFLDYYYGSKKKK